jgi:sigma-54 specific flagellar transcriptional regulator A
VERLAIMHPNGVIGLDELPAKYRSNAAPDPRSGRSDAAMPPSGNLKQHLQDVECELIRRAMAQASGVVAKAARLLKMQRTTLLEKINKYQLQ